MNDRRYVCCSECNVMECSTHGYKLHHVPRNSGRTGGGVGILINDRVKLITRLEPINNAVSFESMEMIITIVSISIRLVVIYRMPPSKKNKLKRGTFVTEFLDFLEKLSCLRGNLIIVGDFLTSIGWILVTVNGGTYLTLWRHSG